MTNYKNSSVVAAVAQQCFRFYPSSFSHFSFTLIQHVLRCSINAAAAAAAHHTTTLAPYSRKRWCMSAVSEILFFCCTIFFTSICVCLCICIRICARGRGALNAMRKKFNSIEGIIEIGSHWKH